MNTKETEEFVFGSTSDFHEVSIVIHKEKNEQVLFLQIYFGAIIDHLLSWKTHIENVCKKTKQRIYFSTASGLAKLVEGFFFCFCFSFFCGYECSTLLYYYMVQVFFFHLKLGIHCTTLDRILYRIHSCAKSA